MPRALPLALLLLAACAVRAAEVFVIADTTNETRTIADAAKESIAEANDVILANENETISDLEFDNGPVVRKKRTFGDIVFRGLADVLGYNVARKPPQIIFPPPLAPVPGIDGPLQTIPQAIPQAYAVLPVVAAAPAPAPAAQLPPSPCGRAATPLPCRAQAPPPPAPPKPAPPPCPKPRANPRPKQRPRPQAPPKPAPPAPCGSPRANPTTASPCTPAIPPAPPKADPNLETITSNFRLDFNFNRAPAAQAVSGASETVEVQAPEPEQEQIVPVAIQPQAAKLPPEPPRNPRIYLDAFVVRNGVAQKVQAVDAQHLNQHQADNDYLVYDEQQIQEDQDDNYDDVLESQDRSKAVREFGNAVDRFWEQKQKPKKKLPANDYRNVHFGDRDLANQFRRRNDETHQSLQKERSPNINRIALPIPDEEEEESTTTTQDPRRPLKPRVLPPTEQNPNQIDTVTVRVPPIYKEKRPKKLHRERPERPSRDEDTPDDDHETSHHEYSYREPSRNRYEEHDRNSDTENSETEHSESVYQPEQPKRKRRRKNRRIRSTFNEHYTAGDYDYYGNKIPISKEEEFFRGLTIPPPTKDADLARLEQAQDGNGHFLDDNERLRDDTERIKSKRKNRAKDRRKDESEEKQSADESERSDESESPNKSERSAKQERPKVDGERAAEDEHADDNKRTDKLNPKSRVHETGHKKNYVRSHNVQVDDPQPSITTAKKKKTKIAKVA